MFSDTGFELGNITLLAGENGCGKSSLIHALLLLKQTIEQGNRLGRLSLYGKYIDLGQMLMYVHYYDRYEKLPEDANKDTTVGETCSETVR